MAKKSTSTPRGTVRSALRQLWLRSRERQAALKRDGYTCQNCGVKQSRAKGREVYVEVHHLGGMDWEALIDLVFASGLLCSPDKLETLCKECHKIRRERCQK